VNYALDATQPMHDHVRIVSVKDILAWVKRVSGK
jgi:hypothetical protein